MATRIKRIMAMLVACAVLLSTANAKSAYAAEVQEPATETTVEETTQEETPEEPGVGLVDESEWITLEDYKLVAESDTYKMYFYEPRVSFYLENKQTGAIMESTLRDEFDDGLSNKSWNAYMKSGVVCSAIIGTTNTYQADLVLSPNDVEVTYIENGFSAKIYWKEYKFGLTVNVTLEGNDVVMNVPEDSIVEEKPGTYISTISLFPFFGYTYLDEQDGYMLIPDGNGALINLDNKEGKYNSGFSRMIYGTDYGITSSSTSQYLWEMYETVIDTNDVLAPVFGMAHTEDQLAYVAMVEDGEERCSIEAHPNGVMVNYNRCFAKFLIRDVYVQPLNQSNSGTVATVEADRTHTDLTVRYSMLSGEEADYSGMAVCYREYLVDQGVLVKQDTTYNTRVDFLGTDREEFLFGTTAVVMTTVDQIEEMYGELQELGVDSLFTVYKGWQKGGIYSVPINKYKADGKIGGTKALTKLIEESAENNYHIYLYNDALSINARTNTTTFDAVKMVTKRTLKEQHNYERVFKTFYYLIPEKTASTVEKFANSYTKQGVSNLAVAGITDTLFSYSQRGEFFTRLDTAATYSETIAKLDETTNLVLEQPFSYLWKNTEAFLDMPLGSSEYMYVDEEIPFLSMVLKGSIPMYSNYINFEANKTEFLLQMVEAGVYPSFYLTYKNSSELIYTNSSDLFSTEFAAYKNVVAEYDEELRAVANQVEGAYIVNHEKMENGLVKVTYDNGVVIYVNYGSYAVVADDQTIEPMSYKVGVANE